MVDDNQLSGIFSLTKQIKDRERAGFTFGALSLSFICIDTMAFLSLPSGETTQKRQHFIAWADRYIKADPPQQYRIGASTSMPPDAACFMHSAPRPIYTEKIGLSLYSVITTVASYSRLKTLCALMGSP